MAELTLVFAGQTKVQYRVYHYLQNSENDNYTLADTETFTGIKGKKVTPAVKSYTGYNSPSVQEVKLGKSTEIKYYYTCKIYPWAANHYLMNIGGNDYSFSRTTTGTARYGAKITPPRESYTGFTAPAGQTITIGTDGNSVTYNYIRNQYTVTCIDMAGSTQLGSSTWSAYYGSTAYGSSKGSNTATSAYYTNYGYTGSTSATVGTSGAVVYRYFELRVFTVSGISSQLYNGQGNPGVWRYGETAYSSTFTVRNGSSVSFAAVAGINNDITAEYGQESKLDVWIYLNGAQVFYDTVSISRNYSGYAESRKGMSHTFTAAGSAQVVVRIGAKQENTYSAAYGTVKGYTETITVRLA